MHRSWEPVNGSGRIAGRPIAGRRIAGRPIAGRPIAVRRIAGRPIAVRRIAGRRIAGRRIAGRPIARRPIARRPIAGRPIAGRRIAGRRIAVPSEVHRRVGHLIGEPRSAARPSEGRWHEDRLIEVRPIEVRRTEWTTNGSVLVGVSVQDPPHASPLHEMGLRATPLGHPDPAEPHAAVHQTDVAHRCRRGDRVAQCGRSATDAAFRRQIRAKAPPASGFRGDRDATRLLAVVCRTRSARNVGPNPSTGAAASGAGGRTWRPRACRQCTGRSGGVRERVEKGFPRHL